jgi:hypothetical protein
MKIAKRLTINKNVTAIVVINFAFQNRNNPKIEIMTESQDPRVYEKNKANVSMINKKPI